MRTVYKLRNIAEHVGVPYGTLYGAIRRGDVPGVRWEPVGPGCQGMYYSSEDVQCVRRWAARRRRGRVVKLEKYDATSAGTGAGEGPDGVREGLEEQGLAPAV